MAFGFSGRRRRPGVVAAPSAPSPALFVAPGLPATIGETTVLVRGRESPVATRAAASLNRCRSAVNNAAVLRPPDAPPVSQPAAPPPATPVDFEGLGVFYMGERVDPDSGRGLAEPVLLKAKRLCTHAVCVGMTGSGKTGLLVGLLEEAALDGIPAVVIDPKGDLGSLLLSFPDLAPESFRPWVDPDAARREGLSVEELAGQTAARWSEGLAASGQSAERIARLRQSVEMAIYTPGSRAGRPLAMLGSLDPPTEAVRNDPERLRERLDSVASGILALAGIDAEPGRSREHVLLCTVIDALWKTGRPLSLGELIRALPAPPVERVGFFELEHFYPAADRFELAGRLNLVAASPGFEARLEGEPADIGRLLWTPAGRPRVSIVSIAHLSDAERMAFVTLLAGQAVSWMRSQRGTSSLRAIFMMDEVFGYLPPSANPPSKLPILTLLKQARAFGLGVVLATQNPVDLDYKGLSNAGTWFLGRLQTARDKVRVVDGLEGAAAAAGDTLDRGRLDRLLSGLGSRTFLLHSVHDDDETVFRTRWTLSYLRGPLAREEIARLTPKAEPAAAAEPPATGNDRPAGSSGGPRPVLPPGVREVFLAPAEPPIGAVLYRPALYGRGRIRFATADGADGGIDISRQFDLLAPAPEQAADAWRNAAALDEGPMLEPSAREGDFASLPSILAGPKGQASLATSLATHLARTGRLRLWRSEHASSLSRPGESETDYRLRIAQEVREARDAAIEKLRERHATQLDRLAVRIDKARQKLDRERSAARGGSVASWVSVGVAIYDVLRGRGGSRGLDKVSTSVKSATKASQQQAEVAAMEENIDSLIEESASLREAIEREVRGIRDAIDPLTMPLEPVEITPRSGDVAVEEVAIAWVPDDPAAVIARLRERDTPGGQV